MPEISMSFMFLALYATLLLLPLVPTLLIYWLFPKKNKLVVKGPFAGLSFRAGGAIGAYVLILAAVYTVLVPKMEARMNRYEERLDRLQAELWTLKADIIVKQADGKEFPRSVTFQDKLRVLSPNTYRFDSYGASIKFERVDGVFPNITIGIPNFAEQAILLRSWPPSKLTVDESKRIVKLNDPIILQAESSGGAVQAAAATQSRAEDSADRPR